MPKPCDLTVVDVSITGSAATAAAVVGSSTALASIEGTTLAAHITGTSTLVGQITGTSLEICDTAPAPGPTADAWATETDGYWLTELGDNWILEGSG